MPTHHNFWSNKLNWAVVHTKATINPELFGWLLLVAIHQYLLYLVWAMMGLNISICLYYLMLHVKHVLSDLNKLYNKVGIVHCTLLYNNLGMSGYNFQKILHSFVLRHFFTFTNSEDPDEMPQCRPR